MCQSKDYRFLYLSGLFLLISLTACRRDNHVYPHQTSIKEVRDINNRAAEVIMNRTGHFKADGLVLQGMQKELRHAIELDADYEHHI